MPKMASTLTAPRAARGRSVFLSALTVLGLVLAVLLFSLPSPWCEISVVLVLVGLVVIIPVSRIWANHYTYQLAKLEGRAEPLGGYMPGGNGWQGGGEAKPIVKPVFINDKKGGRHVL